VNGHLARFGNENSSEDPKTYTVKNGLKQVKKLAEEWEGQYVFLLALWFHPELHYEALEKYQRMTGHQFPGSPRG
jgi:hypothetical protein